METKDTVVTDAKKNTKNIRLGVILSYVSLFISLLGSLFVSNRVLILIGDYNYGLYSFVNSITSWLTVLSGALVASYIYFISKEARGSGENGPKTNGVFIRIYFFLCLFIGLVFGSCFLLLYLFKVPFFSYSISDSRTLYLLFIFSTLNIAITFPFSLFSQFINYKQRFIFEKTVSILFLIFQYVAHFLIAYFTKNVLLISIYSIISTIAIFIINYYYCKKRTDFKIGRVNLIENKMLLKSIVAFSSILIINSIVDQINNNFDKTLLGFLSSPISVTKYQMGQFFQTYLAALVTAISTMFVPRIHNLVAKNDKEGVDSLFIRISKLQAITVCFIVFGYLSCGRPFTMWWIGEERIQSFYVGATLMILSIMPLSVKLSVDIQRAMNKHKFRSFLFVAVTIVNVGLSILFLLIFDKQYAIYACLLGTVISNIICQWIAMNIYNSYAIKLPMKKHFMNLTCYVLLGAICFSIILLFDIFKVMPIQNNLYKFLIYGFIYSIMYIAVAFVFDRRFLFSFFKK